MSLYSLSNSAPINNVGYYDAPIYNQYSNPRRTGPYQQITNHRFNHHIADTYNGNNDNYEIYQTQNYPSQNLFIENGPVDAGYGYTGNNGEYNGAIINKPPQYRRNIPHPSEAYSIENFENQESEMEMAMNANRLDKAKNLKERPFNRQQNTYQQNPNMIYNNQYIPRQPSITYNDYNYNHSPDYLNVGSIPNIAGLYNQPSEKIIIKEVNNDKETRIVDLDDNDDSDDDVDEIKYKKKNNLKKKIDKKKKNKKKKDNMIYLVIFLLAIIIGLMLYIVMNHKVKKVRF